MYHFIMVRGGGGDDSAWHKSGSGLQKLNSIHDFISCAEYLINEKFVHCKKLSAVGHSAGGLLVTSAINKRPKLFGAAILKVRKLINQCLITLMATFSCQVLILLNIIFRFRFWIFATLYWILACH